MIAPLLKKLSRLAPLGEQVANSFASLLLTLILAAVLDTKQFGIVSYLLIALVFPLAVIDSVFGAGIVFDPRPSRYTRALRRGTLMFAGLVTVLATYAAAVPLLLAGFSGELGQNLGGIAPALGMMAAYGISLALFEQLRRVAYASDCAMLLFTVNALRFLVLAGLCLAAWAGWVKLGYYGTLTIAMAALGLAIGIMGWKLHRKGELSWRFGFFETKKKYLSRILSLFYLNAGTTLAYSALELIVMTVLMSAGNAEAVARYRGLQLALLAVNLLAASTENANAARNVLQPEEVQKRFRQTVTFLLISGVASVAGFLALGKPIIGLLFGPNIIPTTFELYCGAALMAAQLIRTPFAILLKFANQFPAMFKIYVASVLLEVVILLVLIQSGHSGYALLAFVIAHGFASLAQVALGRGLLRDMFKGSGT